MHRIEAQILGVLIGALAIAGFFITGNLLFELINVDLALDITRAVLAVALLVVGLGRFSDTIVRSVMGFVGGVFVVIGVLAFFDPALFGILSIGMTGFDIGMHLIVGVAALALAVVPERSLGRRPTATPPIRPPNRRPCASGLEIIHRRRPAPTMPAADRGYVTVLYEEYS